ncbi:hypothetical protein Mapa_001816 [Marchantia paleacea]|nr:hypothetical protein Mapa_001816 [Marchantia paleacea]
MGQISPVDLKFPSDKWKDKEITSCQRTFQKRYKKHLHGRLPNPHHLVSTCPFESSRLQSLLRETMFHIRCVRPLPFYPTWRLTAMHRYPESIRLRTTASFYDQFEDFKEYMDRKLKLKI